MSKLDTEASQAAALDVPDLHPQIRSGDTVITRLSGTVMWLDPDGRSACISVCPDPQRDPQYLWVALDSVLKGVPRGVSK